MNEQFPYLFQTQEAPIYSWIVAARYLILHTSSQAACWEPHPWELVSLHDPERGKDLIKWVNHQRKEPTSGTFSVADLVTHCAGGGGVKWKLRWKDLSKYSSRNTLLLISRGPWSPARLTLLLQPPCLLWFLSLLWPFSALVTCLITLIWPLFPPFFAFVFCLLLTLVLPIASSKEQGSFLPEIHSQSGAGWVPCISP